MDDPIDIPDESAHLGARRQPDPTKRPPKWPIYVLLVAAVIVPSVFWRQVWFGSDLSDEQIRRRLAQPEQQRDVQHACEQISRRMARDPDGARQFYDPLVSLADHSNEEIRSVVAWCMGEDDTRYGPFHQALLGLVDDEAPRVRFNAALALVRFGDPIGRRILQEMLTPYTVSATWEGQSEKGTVVDIVGKRNPVKPLMQLTLLHTGEGNPKTVLAPLGGQIGQVTARPGDHVTKGQPLLTIEPGFQQVYEALRGLALMGEPEDLPCVQRYLDPPSRFSHSQRARVQTQAKLTADAIQKRQKRNNR